MRGARCGRPGCPGEWSPEGPGIHSGRSHDVQRGARTRYVPKFCLAKRGSPTAAAAPGLGYWLRVPALSGEELPA
jgi:hypothetical protein